MNFGGPLAYLILLSATGLPFSSTLILDKEHGSHEWWDYVTVRPHAHMFYWVYEHKDVDNKPLIMWLQGGPGASSTGFGNFMEIGPLDIDLKPRKFTWLSQASLLFVDNPVGSGYSYVTSEAAYTTNVQTIAKDLLTMLKKVMNRKPNMQKIPFYIFAESYGGKMAAAFSLLLLEAIQRGEINCQFEGIGMGDSWIDPVASVKSWGPFLLLMSLIDSEGYVQVDNAASNVTEMVKKGQFVKATLMWRLTETIVAKLTSGVNWYNVMKWSPQEALFSVPYINASMDVKSLYMTHVGPLNLDKLSALMNGPIRAKLGIIPKNVTWGAQSGQVFQKQVKEFMKPVVKTVNELIKYKKLKVVVYSGQLDLIVATLGTEFWVSQLDIAKKLQNEKRNVIINPYTSVPLGYVKGICNFDFYWILNAGHMIPSDNPSGGFEMLRRILAPKNLSNC